MDAEEKRGRGRPAGSGRRDIDIEELKKWARAGATLDEMAKRLKISVATLDRRLTEPDFREALEEAKAELFISLRSKQVALALAGNPTMLIWLGKQYLGQKDKQEFSGTGPGGSIEIGSYKDRLKAEYDALAARLTPGKDSEPTEDITH